MRAAGWLQLFHNLIFYLILMKRLSIVALVLVVILVAAFVLTGVYADRLIDPFVRSMLNNTKPMHHRITYKKIHVNVFLRYIKIKDVRVQPDDSLNKDENIWMDISVSTIKLTDLSISKILFHKELHVGDLVILKPDVTLTLPLNPPEEIIDSVQQSRGDRTKQPSVHTISLNRIIISAGDFYLVRNNVVLASSPDINLLLENLQVAKNSAEEPLGYKYEKVKLNLKDIKLHSESGLYDMSVKEFAVDKEDSTVVLKGFKMIPKYDKKEFSSKLRYQDDRFDINIDNIEIARIGIERLLKDEPLRISSINIDGLNADIYRDKNVEFNFNKFPLFHNEMFLKLKIPIYLDTLSITRSNIKYSELVAGKTEAGYINLQDFTLYSYNLTNQVEADSTYNVMQLDVTAKVMGEGPLKAELILPLEGPLRHIKCSGSVGSMKLAPLNAMLEPSLNIKFMDGTLARMTFAFTADDNTSTGWMEFLYQNLNVELLRKDSDKQWGFVSLLANAVALSNNPAPGKKLKAVEIGFERDKNKGLINYVWKTIQSGMVRTILPSNKYEIKNKDVKEIHKANKAQKPADNQKEEKKKKK